MQIMAELLGSELLITSGVGIHYDGHHEGKK